MPMRIQLTPEEERIIRREVETGRFRTGEEVVAEALRALEDKRRSGVPDPAQRREAVREMLAFIESNHARLSGITVRDLIHEGHRV